MACASEEGVSVPVMVKLSKISSYLSSFQAGNLSFKRSGQQLPNTDSQPEGNGTIFSEQQNERVTTSSLLTSDKIKVYYHPDAKMTSKLSLNDFRCRLKTFGDLSWMLPTSILSVYECVRRGWYLHQQDMLCCCSCKEMVCLQLPPSHSPSYKHALSILHERVLNKHKGNCHYLSCPEPVAVSRPPALLTTPHLYSLAAAAHQLASKVSSGGVGLPYLENRGKEAMDKLGVSGSVLQEVWGSVCNDGWQQVAVLLVLCGWKTTTAPDTIRCELCQRSIGFWHFLSYAEHQQREAADAASSLSELGPTTTETNDISSEAGSGDTSDKSQAIAERTEASSPQSNDSSTAKPVASTEGMETNEGTEEGNELGDAAASNENQSDSGEKAISNKDEINNITKPSEKEDESETRNKRKRAECEDDSTEEEPSKPVTEGTSDGSEALPSKRSKQHEEESTPDCSDSLATNTAVLVEEAASPAAVPVPSKPLFCPFSQHRYWCAWTTSQKEHTMTTSECVVSSNGSTDQGSQDTIRDTDTLQGYQVFAHQLKNVLQLAQKKRWTSSDKYSDTIEGLRSVRAHLSSWAK